VKELIGLCAALLAGAALGAETYKWVDERGVTNYGEKPPAGRPARVVNTQPAGTVEADGVQAKRSEPGERRVQDVRSAPAPVAAAVPPVTGPVRGMDFQTFVNLRTGMSEGELMLRAGRPDFETVDNFRDDIGKSYYYYPTIADPFITVVTVRGGVITNIERNRKTF
jgi:hypothetical protein